MSEKKNKKPFGEDDNEDDIGFRVPTHREDPDEPAEGDAPEVKTDDASADNEEEENFDDEEKGWHTFDMDNPDETL